MFSQFNFEPSKHTFLGIVIGVVLVAVARAAMHF